jgi:hypothetical protein
MNPTKDSGEITEMAIDAHYPAWDTVAREDSNLPQRIGKFPVYELRHISLSAIPDESPYEVHDTPEETIAKQGQDPDKWPPIIATLEPGDEIADGWHRALAAKSLGAKTIRAWVPAKDKKS